MYWSKNSKTIMLNLKQTFVTTPGLTAFVKDDDHAMSWHANMVFHTRHNFIIPSKACQKLIAH